MTQTFVDTMQELFRTHCETITPLQQAIGEQAWKRFANLGLPKKSLPGYQYFPLSQLCKGSYDLIPPPPLAGEQFDSFVYPECRSSYLLFVNGQHAPTLSRTAGLAEGVVVLGLKDALHKYGALLQMHLARALKGELDPFVLLNIAMVQMGLFLYIPQGVHVKDPIHCLHLTSGGAGFFNPRIHLVMGKGAHARLVYDQVSLDNSPSFINSVIDVSLEEGAKLEHCGTVNLSGQSFCLASVRAWLKRDSSFTSLTCGSASRSLKQDFRITLNGENAACDLRGIHVIGENRGAHVNACVEHAAPQCHSNQLFKNVVSQRGRASFEGKIYVCPKAQKTKAYQLNHNLLLGEGASSNSKPNLEIFADDVKASHGATISQLDQAHFHYLRSRGIGPNLARLLLLRGFLLDVIDGAPSDAIKRRMLHVAEEYLR